MDLVQEMEDYLVTNGFCRGARPGRWFFRPGFVSEARSSASSPTISRAWGPALLAEAWCEVAREKLEKHFQFSQGVAESSSSEPAPGGDEDVVQLHHDHPRRRAEQAQETDEIDPDEPSIPPGEQWGVICSGRRVRGCLASASSRSMTGSRAGDGSGARATMRCVAEEVRKGLVSGDPLSPRRAAPHIPTEL